MKLRIVTSILTIFAVVASVSATTHAFFSDTGTSSNNIFTTGSVDLKLSDNDETAQDSISGSFGIANGGPG